jgi:ribosomal-protein-alanine N-acetyltransferase
MAALVLPPRFPFDDPSLPYRVDLMQVSDLRQVMDIERMAFPSPWPVSAYRYELTQNDLSTYLALKLRHTLATRSGGGDGPVSSLLRRRLSEPVLAYGGFWMIVDEAHISTIAVHAKWRGRGLGEMVLVSMVDAARERGAQEVTLEVRVSNLVAQNLYRKYAFAQVGRRKGYYHDNREDALIMTTPRWSDLEHAERYEQLKAELAQRLSQRLEREATG